MSLLCWQVKILSKKKVDFSLCYSKRHFAFTEKKKKKMPHMNEHQNSQIEVKKVFWVSEINVLN